MIYSQLDILNLYLWNELVVLTENGKNVVVVLGGGDFGRALTTCLNQAGYYVVIASRNPDNARLVSSSWWIIQFIDKFDLAHNTSKSLNILFIQI